MTKPPGNAVCPRCAAAFRCGANDAAPCACLQIDLGACAVDGLRGVFTGCLCLACLAEIAAAPHGERPEAPRRAEAGAHGEPVRRLSRGR